MHDSFAVGVDLGGTNLKAALVSSSGDIAARTSLASDAESGPERVLGLIAAGIKGMVAALPSDGQLAGVGIGSPGSVNLDRATVRQPPNFPGWHEVHLPRETKRILAELGSPIDCPVVVDNDANVAGLGSAFYGAGVEHDSFVMVTLGTGVGGAIIINKRLFRGTTGAAGEIGHVSIDYEGPPTRAGINGAVEAYLGQRYLSRAARYRLMATDTAVHKTGGPDLLEITPEVLHAAAEQGDEPARDVLAWAGHKLGVMLGSVVNLLDIRTVIVGGGVSRAGDYILNPAREALLKTVMPGMREGVQIIQETRGNDVALLGAARLVFEQGEDAL